MTPDTPWIAELLAQSASFDQQPPSIRFGDPRAALRAADGTCLAVPLVHLGVLQASGDDAATLLHSLVSNDVKKLGANSVQHNSLNGPKGRMLASLLIWPSEGGFRLVLAADLAAAIQKKLSMYVLRAKAKIVNLSGERALIGLCGGAEAALQAAGLPVPPTPMTVASGSDGSIQVVRVDARRLIVDAPADAAAHLWRAFTGAGAMPAGTETWRWFDIAAGIPLITAANQDEFVAQMLNFELIGGVDFKKGCYPGQEIIARTQYLGKLKKRMYRLHLNIDAAPQVNTGLYSPLFAGQSCGKVVSAAPAPEGGFDLLAVLQTAVRESDEVHLGTPDGPRPAFAALPYPVD